MPDAVVVGAQDAEHGRAVLLGLEAGPSPPGVRTGAGSARSASSSWRAAPLVLDVGDAHAGAPRAESGMPSPAR